MNGGFAREKITPPVGMPMEGFNREEVSQDVHDDLFVRALYLTEQGKETFIFSLDLLFLERTEVDRLKGALSRQLSVSLQQILLNFTHTHSGPRLSRWHYSGQPSEMYIATLEEALIKVAGRARENPREVTLEAATGETDIAINRRRVDEEGQAEWGPSPDGPICRALPVCCLRTEDGDVVALLFSAGCHPTINYTHSFSAEYPGVAMEILNERFATNGAMFLQGAGGDTKPRQIAVGSDHFRQGSWGDVRSVGEELAEDVIERIDTGLQPFKTDLAWDLTEPELPLSEPPDREELLALRDDPKASSDRRAWAEEMLEIERLRGQLPSSVAVRVHGIRLGPDVRLIGVEGELVSELGEMILDRFGGGVTFALGYTNGVRLNIPCDRQLPEGGYGVATAWEFHWPAPLARGVDATLANAVDGLYFR